MDFSERFVYKRNNEKGIHLFEGQPCPSREVFKSIGEAGILHIHRTMKEMLEIRKKMFGSGRAEFYGFSSNQSFFDMETRTIIELISNASNFIAESRSDLDLQFPELGTEDSYLLNLIERPWGGLGKRAFQNRVDFWQNGDFHSNGPQKKI